MPRKKHSTKEANPSLIEKFIILGILLFLLGTINHTQIYLNSLFAEKERPVPIEDFASKIPSSISIPSVNIAAQIEEGGIINGNWVLLDNKALFLPTSGKLGEGYNTVIYAHNTKILFGGLRDIQKGNLIILKDRKGKDFKYQVISREDINPQDLKKLYSTEKNTLTLFTCDGWFDQFRLLVRAKLVKK